MILQAVQSYVGGQWIDPDDGARQIADAATGRVFALAGNAGLNYAGALEFARDRGGSALRRMTFHDRARMLKALALHLEANKKLLYDASFAAGATARDHLFDIDGGIGTMFVFASKGRREMPDAHVLPDGGTEALARDGGFVGHHIYTPLKGVAVHINAFNFPVWGMLEKLAPSLLAGVPSIVKPATVTSYVTEICVRLMLDSGLLPEGALQLVTGGLGDTFDHVTCQDAITFTGSASTAKLLRAHPAIAANAVRFTSEQDSLNASILGPDATPGTPEFDIFIKEATREMTVKAGQKCTAIRRILAPEALVAPVVEALRAALGKITVGDPRRDDVRMGALVSAAQRRDVLEKATLIGREAELVYGVEDFAPLGDDTAGGAFVPPMLFHCSDPDMATGVHEIEAFGPVSTVMGYRSLDHAIGLANRGQGSLVLSLMTHDPDVARDVALGAAAFHGRVYINDRASNIGSTGHGAPMPQMIHGGPGRAGGGEELGGIRGVKHFMQRTALQGSPDMISAILGTYVPGATTSPTSDHPFQRKFGDLHPGQTIETGSRTISLADIEHFAEFTGDTFYAHMDEAAAARNPFFPGRVAHGYLLLSFAAGLFVDPDEGPVLANTGLDRLRFQKPVIPGDTLHAALTVMAKTPRNTDYGEVRWHVRLLNQDDEVVADYELLTMVSRG